MSNNQLAPQQAGNGGGLARLKATLNSGSVQEQFKNALAENKDLFVASIIDLYTSDKSLQACHPNAIVAEALKAAVLDLPINRALGFAYIVVYNNSVKQPNGQWAKVPTPTFIPGYKGYIQMAMRTGKYRTINADFVYEGELRTVNRLSGEVALDGEKKSDKIVGYFCYFELTNGYSKTLYMSVEEMAKYAKRYAPGIRRDTTVEQLIEKANNGVVAKAVGWEGNFNDMALKTVIRRLLSKYGYLSIKMQGALSGDINAENAAMQQREERLSQAEVQNVDTTDVQYEEVADTETGEVTSTPAAAESDDEEPNY